MVSLHRCKWHHPTISDAIIYHSTLQSFDRAVCCSLYHLIVHCFGFLPAQTGRLGAKFKRSPEHIQGVQEKPKHRSILKSWCHCVPTFMKHLLSFHNMNFSKQPCRSLATFHTPDIFMSRKRHISSGEALTTRWVGFQECCSCNCAKLYHTFVWVVRTTHPASPPS